MNRKVLFLDLDGTLLNDSKDITPGNREALAQALSRGHRVVITTGRPLSSGRIQSELLGLTSPGCYLIACNGGVIFDSFQKEILFRKPLPRDTALEILRICDAHGIHVQTYGEAGVLVEPRCEDKELQYYCTVNRIGYRVLDSFDRELKHDPSKVLCIHLTDHEALEALGQDIRARVGDRADCFFSSRHFLEIVPKGVNKGNAVGRMCQQLGVDIADAIAVGDAQNDLPMIQAAGLGVCMANGEAQVKAAADYITTRDNNHDGVAEVVEKFMTE